MADSSVTQFELHNDVARVRGRIEIKEGALEIYLEGFGLRTMHPGFGAPLYLEFSPDDGHLRLYAWADINQEDFSHAIDLEAARELNRRETA